MTERLERSIRARVDAVRVPAGDLGAIRRRARQRTARRRAGVAAVVMVVVAASVAGVLRLADQPSPPVVGEVPGDAGQGFPLFGYEPSATTGPERTIAQSPLGEVVAWPVAGDGVCLEIAGRTTCTRRPEDGAEAIAYVVVDGTTCTIGPVDGQMRTVDITYFDGTVVNAEVAPPPADERGPVRGFAACTDQVSGPAVMAAASNLSELSGDGVMTVAEELRPPGSPSRGQVAASIEGQLDEAALVGLLEGDHIDRAIEQLTTRLSEVSVPSGVVSADIAQVAPIEVPAELSEAAFTGIVAQLTVTTEIGDPFCLELYVDTRIGASSNRKVPPGPCGPA